MIKIGPYKLASITVAVAILVAFSIRHLDLRLSCLILDLTGRSFQTSRGVSSLPDLLLPIVVGVSAFCWAGYFLLSKTNDPRALVLKSLGTSLPIAYLAKDILKWIFGRTNTRTWLEQPDLYAFHWLHGSRDFQGFPSGHMLVLTPIFMALWATFPRFRPLVLFTGLSLAIALMITEYHFLADVIAGTYLGFLVHYLTVRFYTGRS